MIKKLSIVYIVPSRYDDDGYVQRWIKGVVPSNSLAVLKSLTNEIITTQPFPHIKISLESYDDNIQRIPFEKLAARNRDSETRVVVGIVGVQSNQFPRASDIALRFRNLGIDVMIGGFHVTGILALFETPSPELQHIINHGVSLIAGEAETPGVMENVFGDAIAGTLKPIYRFPKAPDLSKSPPPQADPNYIDHFGAKWATIDSSRGCPYGCTFCTVINIQGRKMRCRSSEAVLATVRNNHAKGVKNFFFTDDNFARSAHWEAIFDGLAEMADEGNPVNFMMQIDTQASKIPNFVNKAKRAGCRMVFIGMESVNPENIAAAGKTQNHVDQYRNMVQCWQVIGIIVHVGYIIGFPNDTLESVRRDVIFLRDHVGVDLASFFMMTPLPGSVDHLEMVKRKAPIDPDLNKYDSFHETFPHPKMKPGEWKTAALLAYSEFYTKEHCTNILRRLPKEHYWLMFWNLIWYRYSGVFSGTHPMMTGFFRQKDRLDRRPGMPTENIFRFGWRWLKDFVLDSSSYIKLFFEFQEIWFLTRNYIPGQEPETEVIANQEVIGQEIIGLPKVALPRRFAQLRYWSPLAQLKLRWNTLQQRVAEYNWSGRYDDAVQEIRNTLSITANRLRSISRTLASTMNPSEKRKAHDLETLVNEIENCLTELEKNPADSSLLYKTDQFVREKLLARYEELSCGCVRLRRRVNLWRENALDNLKRRRFGRCAVILMQRPWLVIAELYLSCRFSIAAFRKEL
ncbi:MAG: radical SAM protein [Planctomycetaceae bacterium]|jgi:radical SAM superfamily enzyme YgiQ (UPF0313 family)|nr:radical SAM protein [Planctomycetaceae bacterium]